MNPKDKLTRYIKDTEYSKRLTTSIRNCMFVHLALTIVADVLLTLLGYDCSQINDVLVTMMPVYIALQGANYVKSGYENGKKIVNNAGSASDEAENG